jgi:signal transduction histidine kinase
MPAIATIANAAFALACLTMAAAFATRVRLRGRAILLLLILLTLTAFYTLAALGPAWALTAFYAQLIVAILCVHYFSACAVSMLDSVGEARHLAHLPVAFAYADLAIPFIRGHHTVLLTCGEAIFSLNSAGIFVLTLGALFRNLPKSENVSPRWWGGAPAAPISLHLTPHREPEPLTIPATAADIRTLATAFLPLLLVNLTVWTHPNQLLPQLAMLPSLAGLIYFQTRATFFDVLIKRGAVLGALLLIALLAAPSLGAAFAVSSLTAAYAFFLAAGPIDSALDRLVFRRPDYRQTLAQITSGIAKCASAKAAIAHVTQTLAPALHAEWARFEPAPDPAAAAFVSLPPHGGLARGPRRRGRPYQSQDATFIDGVAAHLAAALEGFDARKQRQLAAEAELRALRAQINPHFLFNSLNSLADMVKDSPLTEQAVLNLARIFRYALDSTRQPAVPLADEIRFLTSYLDIERLRFEDRLTYTLHCPAELGAIPVPPMLIQPLVENAVKHGIAPQLTGGVIAITVALPAADRILVTVADTGAGFDPRQPRAGVGVASVRQRVEALPHGRFSVASAPGQGTRVTLEWSLPCES